ncbi:MucR family transcriptional regulator [Brevundimonas bullata]|jgi:predicted transcriptional regulator|uniref:MucR family transcriptional regulator n=1 Tax=Brevundimonas bullata TaxID=13160 RepID=UPI002FD8846D
MNDADTGADILGMTTDIVSAYVSNNKVEASALPGMIAAIHGALSATTAPVIEEVVETVTRPTASQIRKSITDDFLISFEDGKQYKSMKRSLAIKGLTPAEYREKWGLPADYPMVAPAYAAARSAMAKSMGLGAGGRKPAATAPAKRGRPAKITA